MCLWSSLRRVFTEQQPENRCCSGGFDLWTGRRRPASSCSWSSFRRRSFTLNPSTAEAGLIKDSEPLHVGQRRRRVNWRSEPACFRLHQLFCRSDPPAPRHPPPATDPPQGTEEGKGQTNRDMSPVIKPRGWTGHMLGPRLEHCHIRSGCCVELPSQSESDCLRGSQRFLRVSKSVRK